MTEFKEYTVDQEYSGLSIKEYLRSIQGVSGRQLQKLTRAKGIYLNGRRTILDKKLKYKDSLKVVILQERLNIIPEKELNIEVLYENDDLVVVNKPAGILVHPAGQTKSGTLLNYLSARYVYNKNVVLHALHRLDRDTSGCVMFAKNSNAKKQLEYSLQTGNIKRIYQAIVQGELAEEQGVINTHIGVHPFLPNRRVVAPSGQEAVTKYKLIKSLGNNLHLLEIELLTGRTHQIRVHLSSVGLPILGDGMYGIRNLNANRQLLHAVKMCFKNSDADEYLEITAPVYADMQRFITR